MEAKCLLELLYQLISPCNQFPFLSINSCFLLKKTQLIIPFTSWRIGYAMLASKRLYLVIPSGHRHQLTKYCC